ncbi:HNH endonuclease signature motif containing protein [Aquitalea pelogenes]|uniref:HNH endonuclease signature motif containing protein n=1 Tax=Aquitalea pelogenes TaxID=1293573 RepID=UPI000AFD0AEF|nr:HNH endonuclease signature motif containing protein [Aquitalea pelogenes]
MTIKQKDIKLLWGRSGNRCAICRVVLTQDALSVTSSFTLGEQAHIVGDKSGSARSTSPLTAEQRDSYHNLILLCPTHHTEIDSNEPDWPVERLHQVKSEHELWVTETLSETVDHVKIAKQAIIASIVDSAVELCDLENWQNWTSFALSPDPRWEKKRPNMHFDFRQKIISAIWPSDFEELKNSAITLSILLNQAAQKYLEHADLHGDCYYPFKFYKAMSYNPNYDRDLRLYTEWMDECYSLIYQATKAANWFADIVRRDVNPMFFAEKGKFLIMEGPFSDLSYRTRLLEFSEDEKNSMPKALFEHA